MSMPAGMEWMLIFLSLSFLIVPLIFYILTLRSTLHAIAPQHRRMHPDAVWLLLIPVFSAFWHFVVVTRLSDSIAAELRSHHMLPPGDRPAFTMGMVFSVCMLIMLVPVLSFLVGIPVLVCWIIYWVKVADYRKTIRQVQAGWHSGFQPQI